MTLIRWNDKKAKYLYNPETGAFDDAPKAVNDLLQDEEVQRAIQEALKKLGEIDGNT